jgi:hypothetical protein
VLVDDIEHILASRVRLIKFEKNKQNKPIQQLEKNFPKLHDYTSSTEFNKNQRILHTEEKVIIIIMIIIRISQAEYHYRLI